MSVLVAVMEYPVIVLPLLDGATQLTSAVVLPADIVAVQLVGACGDV